MTTYKFCSNCGKPVGLRDREITKDGKEIMYSSVSYTFKDGSLLCYPCWMYKK